MSEGGVAGVAGKRNLLPVVLALVAVAFLCALAAWALSPRTITATAISYEITGPTSAGTEQVFRSLPRVAAARRLPGVGRGSSTQIQSNGGCTTAGCQAAGSFSVGDELTSDEAQAFLADVPVPDGLVIVFVGAHTTRHQIFGCPRC